MAGDLPLDTAHLLGFAVSMLMYGWYLSMFLRVIEGLWARRRRSKVAVWVTISLFFVTTLNLFLCAMDEYNAWIKYRADPGVTAYLAQVNTVVIRSATYFLIEFAGILADILVIWRLYAIWNKNVWIAIFPAALLLSDFAVGITVCVMVIVPRRSYSGAQYSKAFIIMDILNSASTILLNVFSTALVISRLWWDARRANTLQGRNLYKAVIVSLVESGALFTVTLILFTAFVLVGYLNENFPSPPDGNYDWAVEGNVDLPAPVPFDFGARFGGRTEYNPHPAARVVLSPIESFRIKTFRSSRTGDDSQTGSSASARGSRTRKNVLVTVPSLTSSSMEMRLELEEDQDAAKVHCGCSEEVEEVTSLPSLKFAPRLDYSQDERSNVEAVEPRQVHPTTDHDDYRDGRYG
ncbi:hypothetical protein FRB96_008073 [Tulasnella sp. 330]|nr:hypothetical protein FRB96_008073 [Tulasnella sp. 330]